MVFVFLKQGAWSTKRLREYIYILVAGTEANYVKNMFGKKQFQALKVACLLQTESQVLIGVRTGHVHEKLTMKDSCTRCVITGSEELNPKSSLTASYHANNYVYRQP